MTTPPRGVLDLDADPIELHLIQDPYDGQRLRLTGEERSNGDLEVVRLSRTGVPVEVTYVPAGTEGANLALLAAADQFYAGTRSHELYLRQQSAPTAGGPRLRELERFVAELIMTAGALTVTDALEVALEPGIGTEHNPHLQRWAREITDQLTQQ